MRRVRVSTVTPCAGVLEIATAGVSGHWAAVRSDAEVGATRSFARVRLNASDFELHPSCVKEFDGQLTGKSAFTGAIRIASSPATRTGYIRTRMVDRRGFRQRVSQYFSIGLAYFTYTRPPRRVQVESRRAWILAHRFFRQFADTLVIYEVASNRIADKRKVSPEPPGRLVRNRGAHEPDGFGIPPLPHCVVVDCVQLVRARAQAGESLAGTHHSLSGASRLSLLRGHEETENRKQPATRERRAVLNGWEVATGELGALEREKHHAGQQKHHSAGEDGGARLWDPGD